MAERVGDRVRVFWEAESEWFEGVVAAFSDAERRFLVQYDDGEEQWEDADGATPIEFLSTSEQQQQLSDDDTGEHEPPPPSPNYADDDYDDYEDDAAARRRTPTPEEEEYEDSATSRSPALSTDKPPASSDPQPLSRKQQQPPPPLTRKPTLHVNNAVFFRDDETLRDMRQALQQEKSALAHEKQAIAAQVAAQEQLSVVLKRELQELKNRVTLASVLSHAPHAAVGSSRPKTASDWRERVLDLKLQNKQRRQELAELGACVQRQQLALQQRQRQREQLRSRLAQVPRRDLCTLVDVQVEIAKLLEEKRGLLDTRKPNQQQQQQQPPPARARDGSFGWSHGSDDTKVALEKELGRLELACSRAKDEILRWKLSFERENARVLPLQARRIALQQELAKFEAADVLLRSVFLRLGPDASGTIAAQTAVEALVTLAPPDRQALTTTDAVRSALQAQNALPPERLAFVDFVACFRRLFQHESPRTTYAVS